ncbi:hypothetical protein IID27_02065 [Patescibacteria group bacterium]|nr:hypothetical protein [Patescibacteria group bacterium]
MASFRKNQTLNKFQTLIGEIYALTDDRTYSLWDLLTQQQRFTMRALKGIRKGNKKKLIKNLMISLSWLMAIANRFHITIEDEVWRRFPMCCSYCGKKPCECKQTKLSRRKKIRIKKFIKPRSLSGMQRIFNEIYPSKSRTLADAGVHWAEEMGEVSEAIHNYLGQHFEKQFDGIKHELADCTSCIFGVANSADINIAIELEKMFYKNCHVCHEAPCICTFTTVSQLRT